MYELTPTGRQWICRKLGMLYKWNNIFVKNNEAFNNRMNILSSIYNIDELIQIYKNELNNFKSEQEYNEFLRKSIIRLSVDIKDKTEKATELINLLSNFRELESVKFFKHVRRFENPVVTNTYLRIYFDYPIYEGFKFLCQGLYDLEDDAYDYIYNTTKSKFIAYNSDIDIADYIDKETMSKIKNNMLFIGANLFSILSPKFINVKEVNYIGNSEIIYVSSSSKSVSQINNIMNCIRNDANIKFENANIELYSIKHLASNNDISEKVQILPDKHDLLHNLINCDEVTLLAYLRKQKGEPISKYDKYFNYKGTLARIQDSIKIDWV